MHINVDVNTQYAEACSLFYNVTNSGSVSLGSKCLQADYLPLLTALWDEVNKDRNRIDIKISDDQKLNVLCDITLCFHVVMNKSNLPKKYKRN